MASLVGMSGVTKGKTLVLDQDRVSVGRSKDNVISLDETTVSGHHALILDEGGRFIVRDLQSTNGTRVNGREIRGGESVLKAKDLVQFGSVEFVFEGEPSGDAEEDAGAMAVEVTAGPVAAPDSFTNMSPFGARKPHGSKIWTAVLVLSGVVAIVGVVFFTLALFPT